MAVRERKDVALNTELDAIDHQLSHLKILYEKYFSGLERVEPLRERDELRRRIRDLMDTPISNATQRFRFIQVRARAQTLELYWTRNLNMMERGTHPKMRFRADHKAARLPSVDAEPILEPVEETPEEAMLRRRREQFEKEERALRVVYDRYLEARAQCGQTTDLAFDTVRATLRQHVRQVKSQFAVDAVKFRIYVEEGKAKVRAIPVQKAEEGG